MENEIDQDGVAREHLNQHIRELGASEVLRIVGVALESEEQRIGIEAEREKRRLEAEAMLEQEQINASINWATSELYEYPWNRYGRKPKRN